MPICTYMTDGEINHWKQKRNELDKEFLDVIEDYEKVTGESIIITWILNETGWFKKQLNKIFSLNFPLGHGEVQIINFPDKIGESSINTYPGREKIMAYLLGYTAGYDWARRNNDRKRSD